MPDDLALCHEIIRQPAETIRESQGRIEQLEHQVEQLLRGQFGPRRERVDPDQLRLFADEATDGVMEATAEEPLWRGRETESVLAAHGPAEAPRGSAPQAGRERVAPPKNCPARAVAACV